MLSFIFACLTDAHDASRFPDDPCAYYDCAIQSKTYIDYQDRICSSNSTNLILTVSVTPYRTEISRYTCMQYCGNYQCDFFHVSEDSCELYQNGLNRNISQTYQMGAHCFVKQRIPSRGACVESDLCASRNETCMAANSNSARCRKKSHRNDSKCFCRVRIIRCDAHELFDVSKPKYRAELLRCGPHSTCLKALGKFNRGDSFCGDCHEGYSGIAPNCVGSGLCTNLTHVGDPCNPNLTLTNGDQEWDGVCTLEFNGTIREASLVSRPVSLYVCRRRYDGDHGAFLNVSSHFNMAGCLGIGSIRPGTAMSLPANSGKSFAVILRCEVLFEAAELPREILAGGGRVVFVSELDWSFEHCSSRVQEFLRSHEGESERVEIIAGNDFWRRGFGPFYLLEKNERWTRIWVADSKFFPARYLSSIRYGHFIGKDVLLNTLRYLNIEGRDVVSNGRGKCIIGKKVFCQNAKHLCELSGACSNDGSWMRGEEVYEAHPHMEANGWGPMDFTFSTVGTIFDEISSRHYSEDFALKHFVAEWIKDLLKEHFGCTQALYMDSVPYDVVDHVDAFYFWLDETTVMMGTYNASTFATRKIDLYLRRQHQNRQVLEDAGLVVKEVPMPARTPWRSFSHFTSIVVTNASNPWAEKRTLLMPIYASERWQTEAQIEMAEYAKLRAVELYEAYNFTVVPVDMTDDRKHRGIYGSVNLVPFIEGECGQEQTLKNYFECLEGKIPHIDKMKLREREFQAEVNMRNIMTQREWDCRQNETALRCEAISNLTHIGREAV